MFELLLHTEGDIARRKILRTAAAPTMHRGTHCGQSRIDPCVLYITIYNKSNLPKEGNGILSLFERHNILLSSSAVLRFSIQSGSIGPSNTNHRMISPFVYNDVNLRQ